MSIRIAVISYRNARKTELCIQSLLQQTYQDMKIIVWDNASPDGSGAQLAAIDFGPKVTVVQSGENLMWSPAVNRSLEGATEDYVAFMNNDLELEPGVVKGLVELLGNDSSAGAAVPMGSGIGGPQDYATHFQAWNAERPGRNDRGFRQMPAKRIPFFVGTCVVLPRTVWTSVGPLDENMPLGADDHDYSLRLKHDGYSLWTASFLYVRHHVHSSGVSPEWEEWGGKSWASFNEKWGGYFISEEEAIRAHWGGVFDPAVTKGTGWSEEEYDRRVRHAG